MSQTRGQDSISICYAQYKGRARKLYILGRYTPKLQSVGPQSPYHIAALGTLAAEQAVTAGFEVQFAIRLRHDGEGEI